MEIFKHKMFNVAVISIIDKNYDDALKSAVMLNEQFGLNIHSKIIVLTVEICKYIDITICYKSIIAINKIFHKIKNRKIQGEYGEYVRSMLTYNETGHLRSGTQRM